MHLKATTDYDVTCGLYVVRVSCIGVKDVLIGHFSQDMKRSTAKRKTKKAFYKHMRGQDNGR